METKTALTQFAALAQETRLAIFRQLVEWAPEGAVAGMIGERLGLAPATLSFHLKELAHADLIVAHPQGRFIRYTANLDAVPALVGFLTRNCCGNRRECAPVTASASANAARKRRTR